MQKQPKVFQRTYTKPIPDGAKILRRRCGKVAQFTSRGKVKEARLTADGKRVLCTSANWFVIFEDTANIKHTIKGFTSDEPTKVLAGRINRLLGYQAVGKEPDIELTTWFNRPELPDSIRGQLIKAGLLEPQTDQGQEDEDPGLLLEDLVPAFEGHLTFEKERDPKHISNTIATVNRILKACEFTAWDQIEVGKVRAYLLSRRAGPNGISKKTFNAHVQAVRHFCEWVVDAYDQVDYSPLAKLKRLDKTDTDRRYIRRALAEDECRRLLETTAREPEREGIDGPERALLYRFMLNTGLRVNECRTLNVSDLALNGPSHPFVRVRAVNSKHRKEDRVPLRKPLVAALRAFIRDRRKLPTANVFGGRFVHLSAHVCSAFKEDLQAAGIDRVDVHGHVVDLHGLRHTYITRLGKSGLDIDTVKELARHSSINTTAKYMHTSEDEKRAGIERLPDYGKTGTDHG